VHHNYAWEPGWPKIYRFPWEIRIDGAYPDGYQPDLNAGYKSVAGSPHSNGGGFVAATATVASTVYVGPKAVVVGTANVTGNVRISGKAVVKDNARVQGNAIVDGFAVVGGNALVSENAKVTDFARVNNGAQILGSAIIRGSASVFNSTINSLAVVKDNASMWGANLSGNIIVGGDAEHFAECGTGTYLQIWNLGNRGCDGLTNHSLNTDINQAYAPFSDEDMGVATSIYDISLNETKPYIILRDPYSGKMTIKLKSEGDQVVRVVVSNITGSILYNRAVKPGENEIYINPDNNLFSFIQIYTKKRIYGEKIYPYRY